MNPITLIRNFFNQIINIGVSSGDEPHLRIIIQVVNLILFIGFTSSGIALISMVLGPVGSYGYYPHITTFLFFLICAFGLYLNYHKYYDGATAFATVGIASMLFFNLLYFEFHNEHRADLVFLPIAVAAPLAFRKKWIGAASFFYIFLLLAIVLWTNDYKTSISTIYYVFLITIGMVTTTLMIIRELSNFAKELGIKNEELLKQNKKQEELIHQNNLKTELLGILAHDLKGPAASFNILSKKVAFLLRKERYNELEKLGVFYEEAGDKIYREIDRLLNWTIAQKENIVIRESEFSPSELVDKIIDNLNLQFKDKVIVFENNVPKPFILTSDPSILEIIFKNLLKNAASHTKDGECITITDVVLENSFSIKIYNPGKAIPSTIVEQAKAGKYQKSQNGHGLGLGICFSLIQFLEGEISFDTKSNPGTTAVISLPIKS